MAEIKICLDSDCQVLTQSGHCSQSRHGQNPHPTMDQLQLILSIDKWQRSSWGIAETVVKRRQKTLAALYQLQGEVD